MPPHVALLLRCAGARPSGRVIPDGSVNWERFATLVEHHGMGPHVHAVCTNTDAVPPCILQALAQLNARASSYSLLLTARLLQLLAAFERGGVPVVTLKGPALAQQLYGDSAMRDSLDLDLLVPVNKATQAIEVLASCGYALESALSWLGVPHLVATATEVTCRHASGTAVDLHWASAPADYPFAIPEARLWASVTSLPIAGRPVPVLAVECQLVYLAIHGTRHAWTKLRWLCDVAMLLSSARTIEWGTVKAICGEARATRALRLALLLVHDLLGAAVPNAVLEEARRDTAVVTAAEDARRRLTAPEPAPQPTPLGCTLFSARLAPNPWRKTRHVAALLKAPTEADASVVHLPRPLLFLYYPLRAARLAAKYGRAMVAG